MMMAEAMVGPEGTTQEVSQDFKIILVEDDHDLRQSLADYLRLRNLRVTEAPSGIAFYKALRNERYDIAVLDVNLPDVSGFELARDLAAQPEMGIILLTARTGREDRVRGYAEGADLYLTKPVDTEELALAILNLGRRMRRRSDETANARGGAAIAAPEGTAWRLDRQTQTLCSPDTRSVKLSVREVVLLEHLAARPDETVSRDLIMGLFGHARIDPESRRFDALLARLRSKLKTAGMESPLQVVHGAGVRLVRPIGIV
ncbi:response regulator transcription factor [Bosea sp. ASV33]|uniref:response regulator transcription factor n=1 Tax=Bosea sp. ASV33 TaxID=2795106 RepID=UPI0018EA7060|nr:response regulator transcription factor [Bosea sp. ASV33]